MTVQIAGFRYGNTTFPLTAGLSGASLLETCDPNIGIILDYLAQVIETHAGAAIVAACASGAAPITAAVAQKVWIEPRRDMLAKGAGFQFPMLAVWRRSGTWDDHTTEYRHDTSRIGVAYVLPPLSAAQALHVAPALTAIAHIVDFALKRGYDATYRGGERILIQNNIEKCKLLEGSFEPVTLGDSDAIVFHSWVGELMMVEGNELYDAPEALELTTIQTVITDQSVEEGNPADMIVTEWPEPPPDNA